MVTGGKIDIILDEYMKKHGFSRNFLAKETGLQYSQVLKYCNNDCLEFNLKNLTRICTALDCEITDIFKLTKGEKIKL